MKIARLDSPAIMFSAKLAHRSYQGERGLTLVELLVALVISLLIALVAISSLTVARRGFSTVDASSQLRDNGRFAADMIQRVAVQSGFKDYFYAAKPPSAAENAANFAPNVYGFNNSTSSSSAPLTSATARTSGSLGDGSDVLILRYQQAETYAGSGVSDNSMIDCMGNSSAVIPTNREDRVASIFEVRESPQNSGELALMCTRQSPTTGNWETQPIVQGVETFQVLYGIDGFDTLNTQFAGIQDSVPETYLRADQMTVTGANGAEKTNNNWRRVRSLRIGMVLRGPANSAQDKVTQTLYPFGKGKSSSTGTEGSALSAATDDPGTVFNAPADGRLRQVVTFTVHLRNDQGI